jgi:hypothetical protein
MGKGYNELMRKDVKLISEVGIFLAGVIAAGVLTARRRDQPAASGAVPAPGGSGDWRVGLEQMQNHLSVREAAMEARLKQVESRLDEHTARLAELPSTQQIVSAMEQLIAKTMNSLDDRLSNQAHSIEVLKTTVSQTDSLLERVLESLDSLQNSTEPLELTGDTLLQRQAG